MKKPEEPLASNVTQEQSEEADSAAAPEDCMYAPNGWLRRINKLGIVSYDVDTSIPEAERLLTAGWQRNYSRRTGRVYYSFPATMEWCSPKTQFDWPKGRPGIPFCGACGLSKNFECKCKCDDFCEY